VYVEVEVIVVSCVGGKIVAMMDVVDVYVCVGSRVSVVDVEVVDVVVAVFADVEMRMLRSGEIVIVSVVVRIVVVIDLGAAHFEARFEFGRDRGEGHQRRRKHVA
jgi:hypothetical protein